MATNENISSTVIEISDSSEESESESEKQDIQSSEETTTSRTGPPTSQDESNPLTCSDVDSPQPPTEPNKTESKKPHNRRKSLHRARRCTDDLEFEPVYTSGNSNQRILDESTNDSSSNDVIEIHSEPKKLRPSNDNPMDEEKDSAKETQKERWNESSIEDAIDDNMDDPETTRLLQKIAYCRVFTNYLLRQYDMLAIDFKLYSNIDLLMLELKKRVDTYSAIRRSRQRLLKDVRGNKST